MLLWIFVCIISTAAGAKILVISPLPVHSHQLPILALTKGLLAKGHNITILTTNPSKKQSENYTEVDLSFSYKLKTSSSVSNFFQQKSVGTVQAAMATINMMADFYHQLTVIQYESPVIQEFIKSSYNETYDLVIAEVLSVSSYLAISHIVKAPVISISTMQMWNFFSEQMGNPFNPSYVPSVLLPYNDHMSLIERIENIFVTNYISYVYNWKVLPVQEYYLRKHFGKDFPSISELEARKSLQLHCVSPILSYPQPTIPSMIHVGALHIEPPNTLPTDLKEWIEEAKEGVIYFSFGSNFQGVSLPVYIRESFITAFSKFPKTRFLWKWESNTFFPGQTENVRFMKWVPQQDLLAHPNIRGFITQGGIQSLQETVHYSVPIIGVPMYIDQGFNIKKVVSVGAGVKLEFVDINQETVYNALNAIINDKSYKTNMVKLSQLTKDEPQPPMETAIWWVEYVLRNKGSPFRIASLDMAWYQYFLLDVNLYLLSTLILAGYTVLKVAKQVKLYVCDISAEKKMQ